MDERRTIIFFRPSDEVNNKYFEIYNQLSSRFHNEYMSHAISYDWSPHVMVFYSPMPVENTTGIIQAISRIAEKTIPFIVKFDKTILLPGGFISAGIDDRSGNLSKLNDEIVNGLSLFRGEGIMAKYLEKMDAFTEEERERIKKTGHQHKYTAHLSIAKLLPEENQLAMKLLADRKLDLSGEEFLADILMFAQDNLNPDSDWPVIAKFPLGRP